MPKTLIRIFMDACARSKPACNSSRYALIL